MHEAGEGDGVGDSETREDDEENLFRRRQWRGHRRPTLLTLSLGEQAEPGRHRGRSRWSRNDQRLPHNVQRNHPTKKASPVDFSRTIPLDSADLDDEEWVDRR